MPAWSPSRPRDTFAPVTSVNTGRLANRTALITGAGSGIGRRAAELFASEGAQVVVIDRDAAAGEAVADAIVAAGHSAHFAPADVAVADDVRLAVATAESVFGGLHVIFNNAGIFPDEDGLPEDTPESVWDRVIDVNLKGVFFGCKYGIPALKRAGGGSIVNTASFVAVVGSATAQIAYTASKGGVPVRRGRPRAAGPRALVRDFGAGRALRRLRQRPSPGGELLSRARDSLLLRAYG